MVLEPAPFLGASEDRRLKQQTALLCFFVILNTGIGWAQAGEYVCGPLLTGSANFLQAMLDPFTGLPYDEMRCGCRWYTERGVCQSAGVVPQLPDAEICPFAQTQPMVDEATTPSSNRQRHDGLSGEKCKSPGVDWRFVDDLPSGDDPTLFHALELQLHLTPLRKFAGLTWGATIDITRYDRVRIRYRTGTPSSKFELKLNSGSPGMEETVVLDGSKACGSWADETFLLADSFPETDLAHLNYIVLATEQSLAGEDDPVLWVDHLAFLADPVQAAECSVIECESGGCFPDLAVYEPQTGAVNIANAVAGLTLLADAGLLDMDEAKAQVAAILVSLAAMPRVDGWMQDWYCPASLRPRQENADGNRRDGSMTDLPQLYAALMVVETTWPDLAPAAADLRTSIIDFGDVFDAVPSGACPGVLHRAMNTCTGRQDGPLELYGNDALLGQFLAIAAGVVPPAFWSECLSRKGCERRGADRHRWYTTGAFDCAEHYIPAVETGGPFLQLAPLLYLTPANLPIGTLSIGQSAANMLAAQKNWAAARGLDVWGWASHRDSDSCAYLTCQALTADQATPYISAMGLSLPSRSGSCAENLYTFAQLGAGAPFDTGTVLHDLGLRDSWNQSTVSTREDAFLYLDTGWLTLGVLNACFGDTVRARFAEHPVAQNGYSLLAGFPPPCLFSDGFESGDATAWLALGMLGLVAGEAG